MAKKYFSLDFWYSPWDILNILAVLLVLLTSLSIGFYFVVRQKFTPVVAREIKISGGEVTKESTPYQRIVSTSLLGDGLLLALVEPDKILAVTAPSRNESLYGYQFAGKILLDPLLAVSGLGIEELLALKPDLVLVNSLWPPSYVEALARVGIKVFFLEHFTGVAALLQEAERLSAFLGIPGRGARWVRTFKERWLHISRSLPLHGITPLRALYVVMIDGHFYGGTRGTSYADMLQAAGLVDVAASSYRLWPEYTLEDLLELNPTIVVTKTGMGKALCRQAALSKMAACRGQPVGGVGTTVGLTAKVVEISPSLVDNPGPWMLETAEEIFRKVYGALPQDANL